MLTKTACIVLLNRSELLSDVVEMNRNSGRKTQREPKVLCGSISGTKGTRVLPCVVIIRQQKNSTSSVETGCAPVSYSFLSAACIQ